MDEFEQVEQKLNQVVNAVQRAERFTAALPDKEFTGQSPDKDVTATIDGAGKLKGVDIAPQALARSDARELSKAIVAAVESANRRADKYRAEKLADRGVGELKELNQLLDKMARS